MPEATGPTEPLFASCAEKSISVGRTGTHWLTMPIIEGPEQFNANAPFVFPGPKVSHPAAKQVPLMSQPAISTSKLPFLSKFDARTAGAAKRRNTDRHNTDGTCLRQWYIIMSCGPRTPVSTARNEFWRKYWTIFIRPRWAVSNSAAKNKPDQKKTAGAWPAVSIDALRECQRFMALKNSSFDLVFFILSSMNSIAASSSIGCSSLRRIQIFCSMSGSISSSSRRVPERLMLIDG